MKVSFIEHFDDRLGRNHWLRCAQHTFDEYLISVIGDKEIDPNHKFLFELPYEINIDSYRRLLNYNCYINNILLTYNVNNTDSPLSFNIYFNWSSTLDDHTFIHSYIKKLREVIEKDYPYFNVEYDRSCLHISFSFTKKRDLELNKIIN